MFRSVIYLIGSNRHRETEVPLRILREDTTLRHLEPFMIGIVYFESKVIVSQSLKMEQQFFSYDTFRLDIVIILTSVLQG